MRTNLLFTALVMLGAWHGVTARCDEPDQRPGESQRANSSADDVDKELLRSLDDQLFDEMGEETKLDAPRTEDAEAADDATGQPTDEPPSDLDRKLLEALGGEPETAEEEDALSRVGRKMRRAKSLLERTQAAAEVEKLQKRIVTDLDELIRQANRRRSSSSAAAQSEQQTASRQRVSQPQQAAGGAQGAGQDQPAADSTARVGETEPHRPDMEAMKQLVKDLWGHLPDREREQMMQSFADQFLPKYELMIEEYFKRLAEESRQRR